MNVPPPDEMKKTYDSSMPTVADSEKAIAEDAEHARRAVARRFPDDPETGKGIWSRLGIGKEQS